MAFNYGSIIEKDKITGKETWRWGILFNTSRWKESGGTLVTMINGVDVSDTLHTSNVYFFTSRHAKIKPE